MSRVEYADPLAPAPNFGVPDSSQPAPVSPRAARAVRAATIPVAISIVVSFVFFMAYWLPETSRFPVRDRWLTELSPLTSMYPVSAGVSLNRVGIPGTLLLILSLLILWMARSQYWVARMWIWAPVMAGAAICVVTTARLATQDELRSSAIAVILMVAWVTAAGMAAWLSMLVDVGALPPKSHRSGLLILAAYVVLGAPATAVGRFLCAHDLRQVAAELQLNTKELHNAALALPANGWVYLTGILAGVAVWLAYQLLPPRRDRRTIVLTAALVGALIATLALGVLVTRPAAAHQVEHLRTDSPKDDLRSACDSWVVDPNAPIQRTIAIGGSSCRFLTTYAGYLEQSLQPLPEKASKIVVRTPEGEAIRARIVVAPYNTTLVVVTSNRDDGRATAVRGLRVRDGEQVWQWSCAEGQELTVRFAGVPGGDQRSRGYITLNGESPAVVVGCPETLKRLDPPTGLGIP